MVSKARIRSFIKSLRLGYCWLQLRRFFDYGIIVFLRVSYSRFRHLRSILLYPPLYCGTGSLTVFVLLNRARFWEGLWSIYSFRFFYGDCRVCVLNDGSLKQSMLALLSKLFPGILIPDVSSNDAIVVNSLLEAKTHLCAEWRQSFVFFRKLIDPILLTPTKAILLLDSDVLHFDVPSEIQSWCTNPTTFVYAADTADAPYCSSPVLLSAISKSPLPQRFCAGYLAVPPDLVKLDRIEHYLEDPIFQVQLQACKFSHFAEQTIYAMEASIIGSIQLPNRYAVCPNPESDEVTMGHYCGGSYRRTWFYTKGIPTVRKILNANE